MSPRRRRRDKQIWPPARTRRLRERGWRRRPEREWISGAHCHYTTFLSPNQRARGTQRYWELEGFDRLTAKLMEEHVLVGNRDREWGDLFQRPATDPLLGEWEVTEAEASDLDAHLGISLDLHDRIYFVGRRSAG